MSHFTVTVALPGALTEDEIPAALAEALAPFDENKDVPRYVKATKAQLIEKGRQEIEAYKNGTYAEFRADPVAYLANCTNLQHFEYIAGGAEAIAEDPVLAARHAELLVQFQKYADEDYERWGRRMGDARKVYRPRTFEESFPAKLDWTDEQVYAEEIRWYEAEDIGSEGEVYSEYNPQSQWDWYVVGGRWGGYWKVHEKATATKGMTEASAFGMAEGAADPARVDVARKFDIDFDEPDLYPATFAMLDSEGTWHEKGSMGWFGMSSGDKDEDVWQAEYRRLVEAESDNAWFVLVDAHI